MFRELLTIAIILINAAECMPTKQAFRIYNGVHLSSWANNPYKFIVMLDGECLCTGSIFNPKTVISAAHCFINPLETPDIIALEVTETNGRNRKSIAIEAAFIPPAYQENRKKLECFQEDISVVRLKQSIDFRKVSHVKLEFSTSELSVGSRIILVGYGGGDKNPNDKLKTGSAVVAVCKYRPEDSHICAKPDKKFLNQIVENGDSGGPLLKEQSGKYVGYGIVGGVNTYQDGYKEMIFASYKHHEAYIKERAAIN